MNDFSKNGSAGYLVNHVARLFGRALTARIKPLGLTSGTFPAILELWENDGLTQAEMVVRLDIEQATMANTLARMERDGLIVRRKDAKDGRVQRIHLTHHARALRDPAVTAASMGNDDMLGMLSREECALFLDLLRKIILDQKPEDR